ncbi:MAG TPA: UDP-N-acetylmuramate--L-alanine ligase [Acidimicrobiales bacterium]|nr:UDP-N-acetylmuramate--L-alanine ligase [Acidimicrobiales bacterium]
MGDQNAVPVPDPGFDLTTPRSVHIIGIGGAGMSPIAEVLVAMGHRVSGSDMKHSPILDRLRQLGVRASVGHDIDNVAGAELVAVSTAVGRDNDENVEVREARRRGVEVVRRADILAAIAATKKVIAVSGTHGKTTTSAMLALALTEGGMHPSFIVGARISGLGTGAGWDVGDWIVVEADESDGTFLELAPHAAIVTSVEPDHLGHYGAFDVLVAAFRRFIGEVDGPCLVCADDKVAADLALEADALTYGTSAEATFRLTAVDLRADGTSFVLVGPDSSLAMHVPVPGIHNALNAAGAASVAVSIGAPPEAVAQALATFPGVSRRFEWRGEVDGVTYIDDYAHLPGEVSAALAAARIGTWRRIVCVFQPHRYSRTAQLSGDFADAFAVADLLVVTGIYGAGEEPRAGVTGKAVADAVLDADPRRQVAWFPERGALVTFLRGQLRPGDLCLTLGAGDVTSLPDELMTASTT